MTESGNYYYNVMPFGLKNAGTTYQRMMNKVFRNEICDMIEVYVDDMIVKLMEEVDHALHLKKVFEQARKCQMRFNLGKMHIWRTGRQVPRGLPQITRNRG